MQNCERRNVLLKAAKFVRMYYGSNRKLMQTPSQLWREREKKKSFHKLQKFSKKLQGTMKQLDVYQRQSFELLPLLGPP